jgi:uncharacterized repeat protein (TIGR01451 family)
MDAQRNPGKLDKPVFGFLMAVLAIAALVFSASAVLSSPRAIPIDGWTATTPLPQALANRNAVVRGDYLYFVAGKSPSDSPVANIYSARIQSGGGLSAWTVAGQLPVALYLHAVAATETDLYVVGGWDGSQTRAEVWRAPFAANGILGAFVQVGNYPVALDLHDAVIVQNRLYVVGGWTGTEPLNTVAYADLLPGGLGSWVTVSSLPKALYRLSALAYNNRIYVTGGYDNQQSQSTVYYANVQPDGTLAGWQTTTELPVGVFFHETVVQDGQLVVLGGRNSGTEYRSVYAAPLNADGSVGAWTLESELPETLHRFAAVSVSRNGSDYLYIMGGLHGADYRPTVYHSTYPEPPTPTPTPTLTPTPTPQPETQVDLMLQNSPAQWVAPGEEIEYTITYHNRSSQDLADFEITSLVPASVELIPESIQVSDKGFNYTYTDITPGSTIRWTIATLGSDSTGQVRYRVRRPLPTPPAIPRILEVGLEGPPVGTAGAPLTYSLVISNNTAFPVANLTAVIKLPEGVTYLSGSENTPEDGALSWSIAELPGDTALTRQFTLTSPQSLVLYDYYATSDEGPTAKGQHLLLTTIGATPPLPPADGIVIANNGATVRWQANGLASSTRSNATFNPGYGLHLPLITR